MISDKRAAEVYMSLYRHFGDSNYDITKYGYNPARIKTSTYVTKMPVKLFQILAKKVKTEKFLFEICVSSFISSDYHISEFLDNYSDRVKGRDDWLFRIQEIVPSFKDFCVNMRNQGIKFDSNFQSWILEQYLNDKISIEVLTVFIKILNLEFKDEFVWENTSMSDKVTGYMKIAVISPEREVTYKEIFKDVFK